ncbi:hypothetical protein DVH24_032584 [Malus domestica]|uniref:Uncharacterized protein n=1 Tax=Malus domestica TaxID=3750 RepID=A0A498J6D1_MALDO|nr:hypothetical protein DVH24_032584 [Malus domestica]
MHELYKGFRRTPKPVSSDELRRQHISPCHIPARALTTSRARLHRSIILSTLGPDHTLIVLFLGTHTRTSQWVTHPGIALAQTCLTSEFRRT